MSPITDAECPFCNPAPGRLFFESELVLGVWDAFPVSDGHALLVTRRHVATWFDATPDERRALMAAIDVARQAILAHHEPDGFNIGINVGEAAGQTVPHLHVHVIPRYAGDVADPRGGVRHLIPGRANYLAGEAASAAARNLAPAATMLCCRTSSRTSPPPTEPTSSSASRWRAASTACSSTSAICWPEEDAFAS